MYMTVLRQSPFGSLVVEGGASVVVVGPDVGAGPGPSHPPLPAKASEIPSLKL